MSINNPYPDWATTKQEEGMKLFLSIAEENGCFFTRFKKDNHGDDAQHSFIACLTWNNHLEKTERNHEMRIAWDYEQTWNRFDEEIHGWQFVFSGGETTRPVSSEMFFTDLFFYLENRVNSNQKILMSAENPDGQKLEELLATLRNEITEKNNKIKSDKSNLSNHIQVNNNRLILLLAQAEKIQRSSYELLEIKAQDAGPRGTPRIGLQDNI